MGEEEHCSALFCRLRQQLVRCLAMRRSLLNTCSMLALTGPCTESRADLQSFALVHRKREDLGARPPAVQSARRSLAVCSWRLSSACCPGHVQTVSRPADFRPGAPQMGGSWGSTPRGAAQYCSLFSEDQQR